MPAFFLHVQQASKTQDPRRPETVRRQSEDRLQCMASDVNRDSMRENKETTADVRDQQRYNCLAFQNNRFYSARHEKSL
jgi:hypothetical protein